MKIESTTVKKLVITGVPSLDAIAVYLEDQGPGRGKATITCFNKCWSYFWGAMGECKIREFLLGCADIGWTLYKWGG